MTQLVRSSDRIHTRVSVIPKSVAFTSVFETSSSFSFFDILLLGFISHFDYVQSFFCRLIHFCPLPQYWLQEALFPTLFSLPMPRVLPEQQHLDRQRSASYIYGWDAQQRNIAHGGVAQPFSHLLSWATGRWPLMLAVASTSYQVPPRRVDCLLRGGTRGDLALAALFLVFRALVKIESGHPSLTCCYMFFKNLFDL